MADLLAPHARLQAWLQRLRQECAPHYNGGWLPAFQGRARDLSWSCAEKLVCCVMATTFPEAQLAVVLLSSRSAAYGMAAVAADLCLAPSTTINIHLSCFCCGVQRCTPCCASLVRAWWPSSSSRPASCERQQAKAFRQAGCT